MVLIIVMHDGGGDGGVTLPAPDKSNDAGKVFSYHLFCLLTPPRVRPPLSISMSRLSTNIYIP